METTTTAGRWSGDALSGLANSMLGGLPPIVQVLIVDALAVAVVLVATVLALRLLGALRYQPREEQPEATTFESAEIHWSR